MKARHASLPIFHRPDPLATTTPGISPYAYCAGDPLNYIDPTGCKVTIYFTKVPIDSPGVRDATSPLATHSFLHIKNENVDMIVAYGSVTDELTSGKLVRLKYGQDRQVVKYPRGAVRSQVLKNKFEITPPEGMTENEFDNKVIETINSIGDEDGITYDFIPTEETEGNCNTSTYTILKKSGVADDVLNSIKQEVLTRFWGMYGVGAVGFGTQKPWTKDEQQEAIKKKYD